MKFISDAMHGRIARFLRILGYDTFYPGDLDDTIILQIAKDEGRIIITRDIELSKRAESKNIPVLLLNSVNFIENLSKVYKKFSIDLTLSSNKSRCPMCNSEIKQIQKNKVAGKVPEKTYQRFNEFWICKNKQCQKIYYEGIHWEKMEKQIEEIKEYK